MLCITKKLHTTESMNGTDKYQKVSVNCLHMHELYAIQCVDNLPMLEHTQRHKCKYSIYMAKVHSCRTPYIVHDYRTQN